MKDLNKQLSKCCGAEKRFNALGSIICDNCKKPFDSKPFKNFNLGMFRQWFGEEKEEKTYTAKELWEMFNQACPLFPEKEEPHDTRDGWCCACDYDIAVFEDKLKSQREKLVEKIIKIEGEKRKGHYHPMWNKSKTNTIQELKALIKEE